MSKELREKIEKEVDEKYEEYLKTYSSGFTMNEIKRELHLTNEDIMVAKCEIEVLEPELKEPKKVNQSFVFGFLAISLIFASIFRSPVAVISSSIVSVIITLSFFKRIKTYKNFLAKKNHLFELYRDTQFLRLKALALKQIIIEKEDM